MYRMMWCDCSICFPSQQVNNMKSSVQVLFVMRVGVGSWVKVQLEMLPCPVQSLKVEERKGEGREGLNNFIKKRILIMRKLNDILFKQNTHPHLPFAVVPNCYPSQSGSHISASLSLQL